MFVSVIAIVCVSFPEGMGHMFSTEEVETGPKAQNKNRPHFIPRAFNTHLCSVYHELSRHTNLVNYLTFN